MASLREYKGNSRSPIQPIGTTGAEQRWLIDVDKEGLPAGFTQIPNIEMGAFEEGFGLGSKGIAPREYKGQSLSLKQVGVQGRPLPLNYSVPNLWQAYKRNEMVFAAVEIKATTAINPRLYVSERKAKEWQESQGHPMRYILSGW